MAFKKRKVSENREYKSVLDLFKFSLKISSIINTLLIITAIFFIVYFSWYAVELTKAAVKQIWVYSMKFMSETVWEPLQEDALWQINVLIIGYWWDNHQWGYLSDTIMLASYNPKIWTVSFLSIPRDLYIKYPSGSTWRINWLFANAYFNEKSLDRAAETLAKKVTEITWVPISYYSLIDFTGFKTLIDTVGWVEIDVPQDLIDREYPNETWWYMTFSIKKWLQTLDWSTALKYVRSRHSTSDFSRAYRQQLVIKALVNKLLSPENVASISKLKEIYWTYNKMVYTNISIKNIIWMAQYLDNLKNFYSFVLTAECNTNNYKLMTSWCFLYYPDRSQFGWASVILPQWARAWTISNYKRIHDFAYIVIYNQDFLNENADIKILNWVDRKLSKKSHATDLAVTLKNNWFNVSQVENNPEPQDKTVVYLNGTWSYEHTIATLRMLFNIDEVMTWSNSYWDNITIVVWNNYIK